MDVRHYLAAAVFATQLPMAGCTPSSTGPAVAATAAAAAAAPTETDAELVARGKYLVRIAGCNDCHTPGWDDRRGEVPVGDWLVGVPLGFTGPWGTTFAPNLRLRVADMDEATWMEFTRTLTTRPIMPYYNIRAMREDDRRALYRFIRSLGPAGKQAPDYLPPGQVPPGPRFELILPAADAAPAG